jgi:hypothetical protein
MDWAKSKKLRKMAPDINVPLVQLTIFSGSQKAEWLVGKKYIITRV